MKTNRTSQIPAYDMFSTVENVVLTVGIASEVDEHPRNTLRELYLSRRSHNFKSRRTLLVLRSCFPVAGKRPCV
jgi:hypothetical protein